MAPMVMTDNAMKTLKSQVKKELKIDIQPILFESEDDNQTCYFKVSDEKEMLVVAAIHSLGDFSCAFNIPKFENDKWQNFYE